MEGASRFERRRKSGRRAPQERAAQEAGGEARPPPGSYLNASSSLSVPVELRRVELRRARLVRPAGEHLAPTRPMSTALVLLAVVEGRLHRQQPADRAPSSSSRRRTTARASPASFVRNASNFAASTAFFVAAFCQASAPSLPLPFSFSKTSVVGVARELDRVEVERAELEDVLPAVGRSAPFSQLVEQVGRHGDDHGLRLRSRTWMKSSGRLARRTPWPPSRCR